MGIAGAGSGCCEVALEVPSLPFVRDGVPILAGAGLTALVVPGAIAGDWDLFSWCNNEAWNGSDLQQAYRGFYHSSQRLLPCLLRGLLRRLELWIVDVA